MPIGIKNIVGYVYISATRRIAIDSDSGNMIVEALIDGIWQPASFETGANSLWVGKTVGVAGLGHHLATESNDGHLHFHVHSEYNGELTVEDAAVVYADFYAAYIPVQPDESEEWTGTVFDYVHHTTSHALLKNLFIKIGATAPTAMVRLQVWKGTDDSGALALDQKYPMSDFSADSEADLYLVGMMEFENDEDYLFRYSSAETFSLKTDTTGVQPTLAIGFSRVREDRLLQAAPWVDGDTYVEDQWLITDRQISVCNVDGVQSGTFAENADKWSVLVDKEYADFKSILAQTVQTTGLLKGGEISIASATTLNWTAGKGLHTDFTDPTNPIVTKVAWDAVAGYTPVNVATPGQYIIAYDKTGAIEEFDTVDINARNIRDLVIFGGYATVGNYITLISTAAVNIGYDGFFSFKDFMRDVIGPANVEGNIISANGANLSINNSGGTFFIIGSNFRNDKEITDERPVSPGTAVYFSRVFREAPPSTKLQTDVPGIVNVIDPTKWDDGSGTLQTITGNKYSVQVVYLTPDGHHIVAFGQETFNTAAGAEEAVLTSALSYEEYPLLERFVRRAFVIVQSNETDLTNAMFLPEGKFRIGGITSGAGVKIHSSLDKLEWDVAGHLFENGGSFEIGTYNFIVNSIEIVGSDGEVNKAAVEDSGNWDTAYGWGDHAAAGYLTTETDPVFTAWDKSAGISITESQISDLSHFSGQFGALSGTTQYRVPFGNASGGLIDSPNLTYSDSALRISNGIYLDRSGADSFIAFKRDDSQIGQIRGADGSIDITESGGSPVHLSVDTTSGITTMTEIDTSKIGNSGGILKLNPDATGIVELFGDADVDNSENGRMLYVWRRAPEGDDYLRFYISDNRVGVFSAPLDLTVYGGESVTLQSAGKDVIFRVGDDAGVFGTYFKNNSNAIVGSVDSLGNAQFNVSLDVPEISNTLGLLKIQPDVQGDVELFGDTDVLNSENSKILKIWRRAPEGNDYIRFYISQTRNAFIHASANLTLQAQQPFTINSVTDDIIFKVGDNAGVKKFYFQDSDNNNVAVMDSNGLFGLGKIPDTYPLEMLSTAPGIKLENSRTIMGIGYGVGEIIFSAGESVHSDVALIRVNASEDWTNTSSPTRMTFYTTPSGSTGRVEAMQIASTKDIIMKGTLKIESLPTSDPSDTGALWNDSGNVRMSA